MTMPGIQMHTGSPYTPLQRIISWPQREENMIQYIKVLGVFVEAGSSLGIDVSSEPTEKKEV